MKDAHSHQVPTVKEVNIDQNLEPKGGLNVLAAFHNQKVGGLGLKRRESVPDSRPSVSLLQWVSAGFQKSSVTGFEILMKYDYFLNQTKWKTEY